MSPAMLVGADASGTRVLIKNVDGQLTLDVQRGRTYDLTASASAGNTGCNVTAASRS